MQDFPDGDGDPACKKCHGRGVVPMPLENPPPFALIEITTPCDCVHDRDILRNVKRGWPALDKVPLRKASPLQGKGEQNTWITATHDAFKSHLKRVAVDKGHSWFFRVINDAELMDSWLRNVEDDEILDPDVMAVRNEHGPSRSVSDTVEIPSLLIIVVGVKSARNAAMPELLLEALNRRAHADKPTWVVDHPLYRLGPNHIAYDQLVGETLKSWEHLDIDGDGGGMAKKIRKNAAPELMIKSLSDVSGESPPELLETRRSVLDDALAKHEEHTKAKARKNWKRGDPS